MFLEHAFENGLAALQRQIAQVVSVNVEQVEGEIGERVFRSLFEGCLQIGEAGATPIVEDHDLAVEDSGVDGKFSGGFRNVAHPMRPVETLAREKTRSFLSVFSVDVDLDAVAIELQLMQPVIAFGRLLDRRSQRRRDKGGHLLMGSVVQGAFPIGKDWPSRRLRLRRACSTRQPRAIGGRFLLGDMGIPDVIFGGGDLFEAATGDRAVGGLFGDGGIVGAAFVLVVLFDEQPVVLALFAEAVALHADERPVAFQLLAVEDEFKLPCAQAFVHVGDRFPGPLVPDHHGAAAVLAFWDRAFEAAVLDGVVLDLDGEALVGHHVAWAFSDRPAFKNAPPAKAKVVMQPRRGVLLNDEGEGGFSGFTFRFVARGAAGFGSHRKIAHGAITSQLLVDLFRR